MPATEYGGNPQKNGVQPAVTPNGDAGHDPTSSEKLMLLYTTGDDTGKSDPEVPRVTFEGLLAREEQIALMKAQGLIK